MKAQIRLCIFLLILMTLAVAYFVKFPPRKTFQLHSNFAHFFVSQPNIYSSGNNTTYYTKYRPPMLFGSKNMVIWSNEWHIAPIHDIKTFLEPFGVNVIDNNLGYNCERYSGKCAQLKHINFNNVVDLHDRSLLTKFYNAYKDDPVMKSADAFVCMHPASVSELFERFNKPMLIIATLRYEVCSLLKSRPFHKPFDKFMLEIFSLK